MSKQRDNQNKVEEIMEVLKEFVVYTNTEVTFGYNKNYLKIL